MDITNKTRRLVNISRPKPPLDMEDRDDTYRTYSSGTEKGVSKRTVKTHSRCMYIMKLVTNLEMYESTFFRILSNLSKNERRAPTDTWFLASSNRARYNLYSLDIRKMALKYKQVTHTHRRAKSVVGTRFVVHSVVNSVSSIGADLWRECSTSKMPRVLK